MYFVNSLTHSPPPPPYPPRDYRWKCCYLWFLLLLLLLKILSIFQIYDIACESTYFGLEEFTATHHMCDLLAKSRWSQLYSYWWKGFDTSALTLASYSWQLLAASTIYLDTVCQVAFLFLSLSSAVSNALNSLDYSSVDFWLSTFMVMNETVWIIEKLNVLSRMMVAHIPRSLVSKSKWVNVIGYQYMYILCINKRPV